VFLFSEEVKKLRVPMLDGAETLLPPFLQRHVPQLQTHVLLHYKRGEKQMGFVSQSSMA